MRNTLNEEASSMARLPALVAAYAAIDGRSERTIQWIARQAREQGLIASGKPGVGAMHMSVADAVNLILACNSDPDPKVAPTWIHRLRKVSPGLHFADMNEFNPASIQEVADAQNLGAALEALVTSAEAIHADLLARRENQSSTAQEMGEDPFNAMIGLDVSLWMFGAEIIIREGNVVRGSDVLFRLEYTEGGAGKHRDGDPVRRQTRYVLPLEVFRACGRAVFGDLNAERGIRA